MNTYIKLENNEEKVPLSISQVALYDNRSIRDILSNETGQDALQLSMKFNAKVLLIKA